MNIISQLFKNSQEKNNYDITTLGNVWNLCSISVPPLSSVPLYHSSSFPIRTTWPLWWVFPRNNPSHHHPASFFMSGTYVYYITGMKNPLPAWEGIGGWQMSRQIRGDPRQKSQGSGNELGPPGYFVYYVTLLVFKQSYMVPYQIIGSRYGKPVRLSSILYIRSVWEWFQVS